MIEDVLLKKNTQFFLSKKSIQQQIQTDRQLYDGLCNLELEVRGYGVFKQTLLLQRYIVAIQKYIPAFKQSLRFIKLEIVGFQKIKQINELNIIIRICEVLKQFKVIEKLYLNFTNYKQGNAQDFNKILQTITHFDCYDLNINFANWKLDLSLQQLKASFRDLLGLKVFQRTFNILRLQLSGWYYNNYLSLFCLQNQNKLDINNIKQLHDDLLQLITGLFQITNTQCILDLRNWHHNLQIKELKKNKVDNLSKKGSYQKSIVSKHINYDPQNIKQFKFIFLV